MGRRTISRTLIAGTFAVSFMIAANVMAQTGTLPSAGGAGQQARPHKGGGQNAAVESNPACQRIISECKKLGFIQGQWKKDNGLWKDCFDPVVKGGGSATRDGKPISVPVSPSDVQACHAVASQHKT